MLFSSGSTNLPKGIVLSHGNLNSNIKSVTEVLDLGEEDRILGSLPIFHSFGFLATMWLPLFLNIPVIYHPNPLDAVNIGSLIRKYKCTILFATPTFLLSYIRKCSRTDFQSLRMVITGAEKLPPQIARQFFEKFGILPMEGYGCTELSPVVSINVPENLKNIGKSCGKEGSVGKAIPCVQLKIIDPDTHDELKANAEGLLLVKGPSVMQKYLNDPEKTNEVLQDGWYNTGDIAKIDERKGYLFITGRLSRFSKIAGEMVSHGGCRTDHQR